MVGSSTAYPPHNQVTIGSPTIGIAPNKLVITVAPHKLICPHGKVYPKKAVAIIKKNIIIPINHITCRGSLYEPKYIARNMCKYTAMKKNEARFICRYLSSQPKLTSLIICSTESNALAASGL